MPLWHRRGDGAGAPHQRAEVEPRRAGSRGVRVERRRRRLGGFWRVASGMSAAESAGPRMVRECAFDALIPSGEIATKILSHLKLPLTAEGFLPIRAPP